MSTRASSVLLGGNIIIVILLVCICASKVFAGTDDHGVNRTVGTSVSIPVVGEKVRVEISPEALVEGRHVCIVGPTERVELPLGNEGVAEWIPSRYGKHVLEYGPHKRVIWVASRPVIFNWWTTKTYPEFITSAMIDKGQDVEYWKKRGITRLYWIGGAYLADEKNQNPPFSKPADWLDHWKAGLSQYAHKPRVGVCLDELYATDKRSDGISIPQAVAGLREAAGNLFSIGIYYSGIEETFSHGMWHLRDANCIHLEECYWGDENIYRKRWQDITLYRIQDRAVLVISPGFRQSDQVRGP